MGSNHQKFSVFLRTAQLALSFESFACLTHSLTHSLTVHSLSLSLSLTHTLPLTDAFWKQLTFVRVFRARRKNKRTKQTLDARFYKYTNTSNIGALEEPRVRIHTFHTHVCARIIRMDVVA